jgi:hypothetical protein
MEAISRLTTLFSGAAAEATGVFTEGRTVNP